MNCSSLYPKLDDVPAIDAVPLLRAAGLRVTRPRLAVWAAVDAQPHADTEAVIGRVRTDLGDVSHQAVYDALRALSIAGVLRRIQPAGSVARYETRTGDNHHHVVCRGCGVIADTDCAVGEAPCLTASDSYGFAIDEAEVIYWGVCPDCTADLASQETRRPETRRFETRRPETSNPEGTARD